MTAYLLVAWVVVSVPTALLAGWLLGRRRPAAKSTPADNPPAVGADLGTGRTTVPLSTVAEPSSDRFHRSLN